MSKMMVDDMETNIARYCAHCGHSLSGPSADAMRSCASCGRVPFDGPRVLVVSMVFCANRMLVIQRGTEPYRGQWAPPGGYVECGECVEAAASREISEETGVQVDADALIPYGTLSLPKLNQVHSLFIARLPQLAPLIPKLPEVLDARWVLESELTKLEFWDTGTRFNIPLLYEHGRSSRFLFFQRSDSFARLFMDGSQPVEHWRR